MIRWIDFLFKPPDMPPIDYPFAARLAPGFLESVENAFRLAYHRGVFDGFVAGVLLSLLMVVRWTNKGSR